MSMIWRRWHTSKRIKENDPVREASHVVIDEAQISDDGLPGASLLSADWYVYHYGRYVAEYPFSYGLNDWEELKSQF